MATLHWLTKRYPTKLVTDARALATSRGHTLAGRFVKIGLSYRSTCPDCGLAATIYPAFPWEQALRGYALTESCVDWRPAPAPVH